MVGEARGRGRPRCPDTDRQILRAAYRLMARSGYARMSVDAVAAEAGVSKPTIYLRYPSKAALATAAIAAARERSLPAEAGDARADLIVHLRHFRGGVERPFGMAMLGTVLAEEHETPDLLALYREHVVRPRRRLMRAMLERARERGELRADADLDEAVNLLIGAYYAQYLAGTPFGDDWPEALVDTVLGALVAHPVAPSATDSA